MSQSLLVGVSPTGQIIPVALTATGEVKITGGSVNIAPTLYSVNLNNANQEYSRTLTNIKKLAFQVLSGGDVRYAYETGKVASPTLPYYLLRAGTEEVEDLQGNTFSGTLYLASPTAGTIVILKMWS